MVISHQMEHGVRGQVGYFACYRVPVFGCLGFGVGNGDDDVPKKACPVIRVVCFAQRFRLGARGMLRSKRGGGEGQNVSRPVYAAILLIIFVPMEPSAGNCVPRAA